MAPWAIAVLVLVGGGVGIGVPVTLFRTLSRAEKEALAAEDADEELRRTGTPGVAEILDVEATNVSYGEDPVVVLHVCVTPDGGASFERTLRLPISPVHMPEFTIGRSQNVFVGSDGRVVFERRTRARLPR